MFARSQTATRTRRANMFSVTRSVMIPCSQVTSVLKVWSVALLASDFCFSFKRKIPLGRNRGPHRAERELNGPQKPHWRRAQGSAQTPGQEARGAVHDPSGT